MGFVLYVHGKDGNAAEGTRFQPLFPDRAVVGAAYKGFTPQEAGKEIRAAAEKLSGTDGGTVLIANSVGAFFCLHAGLNGLVRRAYFISPLVDMERLILDMMARANVAEADLKARGTIRADGGEDLSWPYLCYVREHPVDWRVPTRILYGGDDALIPFDTVEAFAKKHDAPLTVMAGGEHWFHTPEQLRFLDDWIARSESEGQER